MTSLAQRSDVETALLRPLTTDEVAYIDGLLAQASALLRNSAPSVDDRIAVFAADPTNPRGVSAEVVSAVVAGIVKRYMINPKGLASTTDSTGPYSHGETYALRSEKDVRGVMQVTTEDLATLMPNRKRLRAGTLRTRPGLAPRPVGHYGGFPTPTEAIGAVVAWSPVLSPSTAVDPYTFREGD